MSDMQSPPAGPIDEGFVHDVDVALELPPEPPPTGPWVWVQQNLISGATPGARLFNGFLTVAFAVIALNVLQFITSYFFSPERRWGGVTANMKLLMVQAFPNDDLERIWISVGIVMVLIAWSLVSFEAGGKISAYMLATRARSIGVFLLLVTILHSGDGASSIGIPLLPDLDLPASWSGARWVVFLIALGLAPLGYLMLNTYGDRAKEMEIPFVATFPVAMVIIIAVLSVIELPFPNDRFTDASDPIAGSTIRGWAILFAVTVGAYFVGKVIHRAMPGRFRRVLLVLFAASYPIIIMVIQRNPVLIWSDILDLSPGAPLGALLVAAIVGGGIVYWLAAPNTGEGVRIAGALLVVVAIGVFLIPLAFLWRTLVMAFALIAIAAPSFGGTKFGQRRMVRIWIIVAALVVVAFVLGEANTALFFQGTTFLGGFNLTVLLGITGLSLSFPLGVILGVARRSTLPIFRLLATGYIELVRSVPLITWLFFGSVMFSLFLPQGVEFDEVLRVIMAIAIFNAAYVAEQIRGGLQSVGKGQYEAARAMGLTTAQSMSLIILPQAIRAVIPSLVGSIIVSFKDTSLVAIIGLADLLLIARNFVPGQTAPFNFFGLTFQMLFFAAIFYWMVTFTFSRLAKRYEQKIGLGER